MICTCSLTEVQFGLRLHMCNFYPVRFFVCIAIVDCIFSALGVRACVQNKEGKDECLNVAVFTILVAQLKLN